VGLIAVVSVDSDFFAVLDSDQVASIDPDVVSTIDSAGAMAIYSARVELVSWDVELTSDSDGIPALDSDRMAEFDSDRNHRMAAISTGGVQEMDAHVNAGIDLDVMMVIALGLVEDISNSAAAADSDGLMRIDSVVARHEATKVDRADLRGQAVDEGGPATSAGRRRAWAGDDRGPVTNVGRRGARAGNERGLARSDY
jgi:hypothetical protein